MIETLKNAWKITDLRKKILFTLLIIVLFRLGCAIPVPLINPTALQSMVNSGGNLLGYINILTGGAFSKATVFALSISPYITASIVIQLLTVAIPALEQLSKEGEEGRKKIAKITRYATVALALIQSVAYFFMLRNMGAISRYSSAGYNIFAAIIIILTFSAGAMLVVWLGEQIDNKGIGNGISILLFAGIVSRGPAVVSTMWQYLKLAAAGYTKYYVFVPVVIIIFVLVMAFIIVMTNAERRVPIQYAKRVIGRKQYGGQSTHIPIKVNMSGVLPVIFASAILSIPSTILGFVYPSVPEDPSIGYRILSLFNYDKPIYAILYFILIIAFSYFYVGIQYNPVEIANNLRKNNGMIPGIRPGRPTSEFIARIVTKITLVGALFLAIIAILPIILGALFGMNISLGGTSVIIVVGVALDTVRELESQMMMRHYKGFLE